MTVFPVALLMACANGPTAGQVVPDFSVLDVNPTSARFDTEVSPRDLKGKVSGWYFGHST